MNKTGKIITAGLMVAVLAFAAGAANAKDKVKVGFIGPLTGGVSVNGIGGRTGADRRPSGGKFRFCDGPEGAAVRFSTGAGKR